MLELFKRNKTKAVHQASETLESITATLVPEDVQHSDDMLPCEKATVMRQFPVDLDQDFFDAIAKETGKPAKYILRSSLRKKRPGHLDLPLPVFDLLDPFYNHGKKGPAGTAASVMQEARYSVMTTRSITTDLDKGQGILIGVVHENVAASIMSSLGNETIETTAKAKDAYKKAPGNYYFAMYCTIPGYIPPEYREKIKEAKTIARKVGGDVRLIVEANWKLAAEFSEPRKADPIIVIMKGENIAYIDRFDCTAAEMHLAREHAVEIKK